MSFYHGTKCLLPFSKFEPSCDGSGVVSQGRRYGGFFFTSVKENAEWYAEALVVEVDVVAEGVKHFPKGTIPSQALTDIQDFDCIGYIPDTLDGCVFSNILVVPYDQIHRVQIRKWYSHLEDIDYFTLLDDMFDEEEEVTRDTIKDTLEMLNTSLEEMSVLSQFIKYYGGKA